jgi:hypothetical protein
MMKGRKIVPQMVAGSLLTIIVWYVRMAHQVEIPPEVAVAGAGVLAVLVSILTPDEMESDE